MVRKPKRRRTPPAAKSLRRRGAATAASVPPMGRGKVVIRTSRRDFVLNPEASALSLAQAAMRWTYVVRSRQRWAATLEAVERQSAAAGELLLALGIDPTSLRELALAGIVEVSTEWSGSDENGWPERILPWEYVIAGATRLLRGTEPITVVRNLECARATAPQIPIKRVLFVRSEPGALKGVYKFDTERELVRTHLQVQQGDWSELDSPTAERLGETVAAFKPDLIHLSGCDTHLARYLLLQSDKEAAAHLEDELASGRAGADEIGDGFVLAGPLGLHPVRASDLGRVLCFGGHRPRLVSLNFGNSAARIAPHVVAAGAWSAIGIQDNFDDDLSELFYSVLYSRIGRPGWDLSHAFQAAWQRVRDQSRQLQGTGVVLWNATSAFEAKGARKIDSAAAAQKRLADQLESEEAKPLDAADIKDPDVGKWVGVEVQMDEDLNYSMLHNQRPLFVHFTLTCRQPRTIRNVRVRVALSAGTENAIYDRTLEIKPPAIDLKRDIHVPLTSSIARSVHESVRTSVFVEVTWGEHVLYRDTMRVRLTPVDQWRDSETDRIWLPSFVFPRDTAVTRLVDAAQRYVRVLRDDPAAGFDGYQSFDPQRSEPALEVDLQVQAIWSAIVHELRLGYINPPPGYSSELDSQRLRTPSMIAADHSGTCVDLALFFAACLELVDIYPVVFLLEGHAFPGYWRSDIYHDEFREARPDRIQDIVRADSKTTGVSGAQGYAWFLSKSTYREIVQLVNSGKLVPLETVRLTENSGFSEAVDAGRDNLRVQREFEAMVDIALAREKQVTPLPMLGGED
jgi:hypothetical protein